MTHHPTAISTLDAMALLPRERLIHIGPIPALAYARAGRPDRPLAVFLPGGGHLARVAYGHPALRRDDFLDFWLEEAGFGGAPRFPNRPF